MRTLALFVLLLPLTAAASDNFKVISNVTPEAAKAIEDRAEELRREIAIYWHGKAMPRWFEPCTIEASASETRASSLRWRSKGGQVYDWRLSVHGTWTMVVDQNLPHEVCHSVFASLYAKNALPTWLNEAFATAAEGPKAQTEHRQRVRQMIDAKRFIPFKTLLSLQGTDVAGQKTPFYSESYSLFEFLLEQTGKGTMIAFAADLNDGVALNTALESRFHVSESHLERAWYKWFQEQERRIAALQDDKQAAYQYRGYGPSQRYSPFRFLSPGNNVFCPTCPSMQNTQTQTQVGQYQSVNPGPQTWNPVSPARPTGVIAGKDEVAVPAIRDDKEISDLRAAIQALRAELASLKLLAGPPGENGTNGTDGTNGTNGTNGDDGDDGDDGVSVTQSQIAAAVTALFQRAVAEGKLTGPRGMPGGTGGVGPAGPAGGVGDIDYTKLTPVIQARVNAVLAAAIADGTIRGPAGKVDTGTLNRRITDEVTTQVGVLKGSLRFRLSPAQQAAAKAAATGSQ
jgi:hypothetical protein